MIITDENSNKEEKAIQEILQWIHTNNNTSYKENENLARIYIRICSGNTIQVKQLLKSYYKKRNQATIDYNRWDNIYENLRITYDIAAIGLLPETNHLGNSIIIVKLLDPGKEINISDFLIRGLLAIETLRQNDIFWKKGIAIIDYTDVHLSLLFKLNLFDLKKLYRIWRDFAFISFTEVHHINLPMHAYYIINFVNYILDEKFKKKNYFHADNLNKFYEHVPIEILPKDYGGNAPPMEELSEFWYNETMIRGKPIIEYFKSLHDLHHKKSQQSSIFSIPSKIFGKFRSV